MNKFLKLSLSTAIAGVLLVPVLGGSSHAQDKQASALNPKGAWSVKPMAPQTDNGYCALSRQYEQDLVLTLGQNKREEYSFALDFVKGTLNPDRAYDVTLQPGPGQIRAYEMMPASARAMVIRLGYDDSFIKSLSESGELKAEIDGKNYIFNLSEFNQGNKSLEKCMASLGTVATTKVASAKTEPKAFDAKKMERPEILKAEPAAKVEVNAPQMALKVTAPEKTASLVKSEVERVAEAEAERQSSEVAVAPAKVAETAVNKAPRPPKIEINKTASRVSTAPNTKDVVLNSNEVSDAVEDARVQASMKAKELEQASQEMAAKQKQMEADELRMAEIEARAASELKAQEEFIARKKAENLAKEKAEAERLAKVQLEQEEKARKALEVQKMAAEKAEQQKAEQLKLAEIAKEKAAEEKIAKEKMAKEKADAERLVEAKQKEERQKAERLALEKAAAEKDQKKVDNSKVASLIEEPKDIVPLTPPISSRPFENKYEVLETSDEAKKQAAKFKSENDRLTQELSDQEDKLSAIDKASPDAEKELAEIKKRMRDLEKENRELYLEARKARGAVDTAVVKTGNQALMKIRDYEKKLEAARMDNLALSREMEELRRLKEDGKLELVAGDWDLEKSTKRYNEAEREIKRLGLLLEQQRLAHRQEKTELEQMLFDPAVTEQKQRSRLAELESRLAKAEQELQKSGRTLPTAVRPANSPYNQMPAVQAPAVPRAPLSERTDLAPQKATNFPKVEDTPMVVSSRPAPPPRSTAPPTPYAPQQEKVVAIVPPVEVIEAPKTIEPKEPREQQRSIVSRAPAIAPRVPNTVSQDVSTNASVAPVTRFDPSQNVTFNTNNIQTILNKSGVGLEGSVREIQTGKYQWRAGKLAGHAEAVSRSKAGNIDVYANQYIAAKKQQCAGDFASLPSPAVANGKAFELACITPNGSMSSSLLFTQKGNDIIVIGHDIPAEDMDLAMDARDRIADNL